MRIKICRKEAKETILWLKLLDADKTALVEECSQLIKIFTAIVTKSL